MRTNALPDLSRSSRVRERRAQESREKLKAYKARKTQSAVTPGVLVRSSTIGTPVLKRTTNRLRKKYTLSLGNGVEILLPAIPVLQPGWRLFSFPLFLITGLILYAMLTMPELKVNQAVIYGADRISPVDIESISEVKGQPIFLIDPIAIQNELSEAYPELTGVSVEIGLPAEVIIHIEEKEPLLAWSYGDETLWIDTYGAIFPPRGEANLLFTIESEEAPPLMLASADDINIFEAESKRRTSLIGRQIDPNILEAAVKLKVALPGVDTIAYNRQDGLGWIDQNGMRVFIGISMDNIEAKLNMYSQIYDYLQIQNLQPSMISIAHLHAPFYRMD